MGPMTYPLCQRCSNIFVRARDVLNKQPESRCALCTRLRAPGRSVPVWDRIEAFSKHTLAHDIGILEAFKDTMDSYTRDSEGQAAFIWGVPLAESPHHLESTEAATLTFSENLLESTSQVFSHGLAWVPSRRSKKTPRDDTVQQREHFPTWSWASAGGPVSFPFSIWPKRLNHSWPSSDLEVYIEDMVGGHDVPICRHLIKDYPYKPSRYLRVDGWSLRDAMTIDPARSKVLVELGTDNFGIRDTHRLSGRCVLDPLSEKRHREVCKILSETQNSKKLWEALIVQMSNDSYKTPFIVILVKVNDPNHPKRHICNLKIHRAFDFGRNLGAYRDRHEICGSHDTYERVGCISGLAVERIRTAERVSWASTRQVEGIPEVSMGWAVEEIRQLRLEGKRERAETERRLQAEEAENLRKGKRSRDRLYTFEYPKETEGEDTSTQVPLGGAKLSEGEGQGVGDQEAPESDADWEEVLNDNEAESLDGDEDNEDEDRHQGKGDSGDGESPTVESDSEEPHWVPPSPFSDADYPESDTSSSHSSDPGDRFIYDLETAGRDKSIFRTLPVKRVELVIR